MSGSRNTISNVTITTYGTGVGSVAAVYATRISYYCVVVMTESLYFVCNVSVTTNRTSMCCVSGFGTSGSCYHRFVYVFNGSNLFIVCVDFFDIAIDGRLICIYVGCIFLILQINVMVLVFETIITYSRSQHLESFDHSRTVNSIYRSCSTCYFGYSCGSVFGFTAEETSVFKCYSYFGGFNPVQFENSVYTAGYQRLVIDNLYPLSVNIYFYIRFYGCSRHTIIYKISFV